MSSLVVDEIHSPQSKSNFSMDSKHRHSFVHCFISSHLKLTILFIQLCFVYSSDVSSLLTLKAKISDPSGKLSTWKESTSPCTWARISCDKNSGNITGINLASYELNGSIPPEIFDIKSLKKLDLSNNEFYGIISSSISKLNELEYLNLSQNFFEGEIPSKLASLTSLRIIDLNTNELSGSIPYGLSNLPNLRHLNLNSNKINGSLPKDFFEILTLEYLDFGFNIISDELSSDFGLFLNLKYLDINTNNFSGSIPKSLSNLLSLEYMDLSMNLLRGTIPTEIASLVSLNYINLSFNNLTGLIPYQLGNLKNLTFLDLNENVFYGSIPPELGDCPLVELLLGNNQLNGVISPSMFEKLANTLELLELSFNQLTGAIPIQLTKLNKIASIDISDNYLTGSIPEGFGKIPNLSLAVGNNNLTGILPRDLILSQNIFYLSINNTDIEDVLPEFNCTNLFTLQLVGNKLSGAIPSFEHCNLNELQLQKNQFSGNIPRLPSSLRVLILKGNQLLGPLPEFKISATDGDKSSLSSSSFGPFPILQYIDISSNYLNGSLPPSLFGLPELLKVDLSNNLLSGSLPLNFNCPKLFVLRLSNNRLEGELPVSIFKCKFLQLIDLRGNKLYGSLPEQFTRMSSLVTLLLSHNNFSGPLPSSIGSVDSLEEIDVSENQLDGNIPDELHGLANLMTLNLSSNKISGAILPQLANLSSLQVLDLSSNDLEGEIPSELGELSQLKVLFLVNNHISGFFPDSIFKLKNLVNLNVSYNILEGYIPFIHIQKFQSSAFAHNSKLCLQYSDSSCGQVNADSFIFYPFIIIGIVLVLILLVAAFVIQLRVSYIREFRNSGELILFQKLDFPLTVQDIISSTDRFNKKNMIGAGGFGEVYKALLPDGKTGVAVKRLLHSSQQGEKEFVSEMQTLGSIRHRNLVRLIGAYSNPVGLDRFLIYEYMPGGSLEIMFEPNHPGRDHRFDLWSTRLSIALSVGHGLRYLHHDCKTKIIHRDLKPSNILLDKEMVAHISDFGLARTLRPMITHLSTSAFGTVGYMSLEYARKGKATEKSDVYAYGIILLQLVTGKRPTDEGFAYEGLRHWVTTNPTFGVVDWRMDIGDSMQQVLGMIRLGLLCTSDLPVERPYMSEVVHVLENLNEFSSTFEIHNRA